MHSVKMNQICSIHILDKPFKILGINSEIWISKDVSSIRHINFKEKLTKLRNLLTMWKQRKVSLKGKVTIINSPALSQVMYAASVLYVPHEVITEMNLIFHSCGPEKCMLNTPL